ncbi:DNA ligase OB-like domain-containing protein [Crucibulum laeve]|uniref:DNA ligase OB-like domain-containing protein n=1 Tax=Crucibulum laeve TaxID=68775 RepID=A0A5C3LLB1_9AGAR|nr:DNA ligase OB-like domain-containing protein [Crucibulum laeve]
MTMIHLALLSHMVSPSLVQLEEHVLEKLKEIEGLGGESLMLRHLGLVHMRTFYNAEAIVTGYVAGKGKNTGITGVLKCMIASGKTFSVETGLSDKQRRNPPKIGTIIVYCFQELALSGVPRFPSYISEAVDKTEPKDAEVPEHRKPGVKPAEK